ncbi:ParA family protein [Phenylobacterium aquaticum]|uniref:ParA family protein n=1 Tax=Phenylobacterium aquaticum TaxID=1763816 RepID=UPI001F5DD6AE|nr:ParA family protein [Phenylobacterium aquaticum]MCI3134004.1 ParA family protein [Phenylobacterium aquaticum]
MQSAHIALNHGPPLNRWQGGETMASVVTVMNMKGGVGKTTVALHLAGLAARIKVGAASPLKVLAIDYDPQFNLSQALLPSKEYFKRESERKTTLAILLDDDKDLDPFDIQVAGNHKPPKVQDLAVNITHNKASGGRLDLIPSTLDLMYVALGQTNAHIGPMEERFAKFINEVRTIYDLVVIDCHPAGSVFTQTSLRNSDHVIIPVAPQPYAVRGIGLMLEFIQAKKAGANGPTPHILFNLAPRWGSTPEEQAIRGNAKFSQYCLKNNLKKFKAFRDPEGGKGFVWTSDKPYSDEAYDNLCKVTSEVVGKVGIK